MKGIGAILSTVQSQYKKDDEAEEEKEMEQRKGASLGRAHTFEQSESVRNRHTPYTETEDAGTVTLLRTEEKVVLLLLLVLALLVGGVVVSDTRRVGEKE